MIESSLPSIVISGIEIFELKQITDERGAVLHFIRNDSPGYTKFGECYLSEIYPGAIKAWKRHTLQTQNFIVPVGAIDLTLFDDRIGSSSHSQVQSIRLSRPENYFRVMIPPGIWYGFTCVSQSSAIVVNCTDEPHSPMESETLPQDSDSIPYVW